MQIMTRQLWRGALAVALCIVLSRAAHAQAQMDFGEVQIGQSASQTSGWYCPTGDCWQIIGYEVQGPNADEFSVVTDCGDRTLVGSEPCSYTVTFIPKPPAGPKSATIIWRGPAADQVVSTMLAASATEVGGDRAFDFRYSDGVNIAHGTLLASYNGGGVYLATSGFLEVTHGLNAGTYVLLPNPTAPEPFTIRTHPGFGFIFNDLLYPSGSPFLDQFGLVFTGNGRWINIWGNGAGAPYSFWASDGSAFTVSSNSGGFDLAPGGYEEGAEVDHNPLTIQPPINSIWTQGEDIYLGRFWRLSQAVNFRNTSGRPIYGARITNAVYGSPGLSNSAYVTVPIGPDVVPRKVSEFHPLLLEPEVAPLPPGARTSALLNYAYYPGSPASPPFPTNRPLRLELRLTIRYYTEPPSSVTGFLGKQGGVFEIVLSVPLPRR